MSYESILNKNIQDNFLKLKYGFLNKTKELEKFMWKYTQKRGKWKKDKPKNRIYQIGNISKPKELINIDIKNYIPNTFAIKIKFKLTAPYFSKDDDEFYIISNPCLKEKVFKVPMVRGSGWKGALLKAAIEIFKEEKEHKHLESIFRIFGVGNNEYRELFDKNDKVIKDKILLFLAMEIGISIEKSMEEQLEKYFKTKAQKGRAVFYPTYFEKFSLEVINPHDKKTKAGTNPIFYEVVPKGSEGELQIVYIPFDAVLEKNEEIKKQAEQDLEFLQKCINKVAQNGIGAKTKLGWGKFELVEEIRPVWSGR
ncbi:RAMP superfamily CRISPR-associated protein [Caminibacter pacificus]